MIATRPVPPCATETATIALEVCLERDRVRVRPAGALDGGAVGQLRAHLEALLAAGFSRVVVDAPALGTAAAAQLRRAIAQADRRLSLQTAARPLAITGFVQAERVEERLADGRVVVISSEPASVRWVCRPGDGRPDACAASLATAIAHTLGYGSHRLAWIERLAEAIACPAAAAPAGETAC